MLSATNISLMLMINASNISKTYGQHRVVNNTSVSVPAGTIFGLIGPNAAGKTTLIRMLCGLVKPDAGDITIAHLPVAQARRRFGYVAQHFGQYEELSVWENIKFYASMYGVNDVTQLEKLIARYGLSEYRQQAAGTLSGGYKRRLALVCALTHAPDVLFLDEPTAGIDPITRKHLWDEFYQLAADGKTLFVTTHYMEEAERCHELAFIAAGTVVASGTPETIKHAVGDIRVFVCPQAYSPSVTKSLTALPGVLLINQFGKQLRVLTSAGTGIEQLNQSLIESKLATLPFSQTEANLEDIFVLLATDSNARHSPC